MKIQNFRVETFIKKIKTLLPNAVSFRVGSRAVNVLVSADIIRDGKMFGLPYTVGQVPIDHVEVTLRELQHSSDET